MRCSAAITQKSPLEFNIPTIEVRCFLTKTLSGQLKQKHAWRDFSLETEGYLTGVLDRQVAILFEDPKLSLSSKFEIVKKVDSRYYWTDASAWLLSIWYRLFSVCFISSLWFFCVLKNANKTVIFSSINVIFLMF